MLLLKHPPQVSRRTDHVNSHVFYIIILPGNAGKCKLTKRALQKGDFRFRVHAGSAKFNLSLNAACRLMKPILEAAEMSSSDIVGAGEVLTNSSNPEAGKVWNELEVFGNSKSSGSRSSSSSSSSSGGNSNSKKAVSPKKGASPKKSASDSPKKAASPKKSAPGSPGKIAIGSGKLNSSPPRKSIGAKSSDAHVIAEARAYQTRNCPAGRIVEVDGVVGKLPRPLSGALKKSGAKGGMRKVAVKAAAKAAVKKSGVKK
jgi:hypothetical protein